MSRAMGKNNRSKNKKTGVADEVLGVRSLSLKKRNELNILVDDLLKLSSQAYSNPKAEWDLYISIRNILKDINSIEAGKKIASGTREDTFPNLLHWVRSNGGQVENVAIAEFTDMEYGLVADVDLKEGDLVCDIPKKVMMTLQDADQSELCQLIKSDPMLQQMGNVALTLFLTLEFAKGSKSYWHPYINSLPQEYSTVLYFTTEHMLELKGSPVLEPALKQYRSIARQYAYFSKVFRVASDAASVLLRGVFSYQLYCWAVSTIMTRQNYVPVGSERVNALIPVWDMCNHADGYLATEYNCETDSSRCISCHDVPRGGQVLIFYGPRPNAEFLVHNGFVHPGNKHDVYLMRLGVAKADPLYALRSQLLLTMNLPNTGEFCLRAGPEPVEGNLLAFLRVFNMEKDQLTHWIDCGRSTDLRCTDCAVDTQVENKTWNFLAARIQLLLAGCTQADVGDTEKDVCLRLVRLHRSLEKKLLDAALEYVRQRIKT